MENIVGIHMVFEFGQVGSDSFSVLAGKASGGGSKCRNRGGEKRAEIKIDVDATMIAGSAIKEKFINHVDSHGS